MCTTTPHLRCSAGDRLYPRCASRLDPWPTAALSKTETRPDVGSRECGPHDGWPCHSHGLFWCHQRSQFFLQRHDAESLHSKLPSLTRHRLWCIYKHLGRPLNTLKTLDLVRAEYRPCLASKPWPHQFGYGHAQPWLPPLGLSRGKPPHCATC